VLTDRGTEYCGNPERQEYALYLAVENIDHTRTKAKSPQTNGVVERFHKTMLDDFYRRLPQEGPRDDRRPAGRSRRLDGRVQRKPYQGKWCFGMTPMQIHPDRANALPFVADDLFINFDDDRAAARFKVHGYERQAVADVFFPEPTPAFDDHFLAPVQTPRDVRRSSMCHSPRGPHAGSRGAAG
jgi:hypothetical protein